MIASLPGPGLHRWWVLSGVLLATSLLGATCDPTFSSGVVSAPLLQLVSSATEGAPGDRPSFEPTATADGRFVFFTSYATNFTPGRPPRGLRLFRRDMRSGQTTLVPTRGYQPERPAVSADGRYLAYVSSIEHDDGGGHEEVFVRDLKTGVTQLASRQSGAAGAPAAKPLPHSYQPSVDRPSLSADGRYLAFVSDSPNLFPGKGRTEKIPPEIYVRDLETQETMLVSRANGKRGEVADGSCSEPEISADGRYVVFTCSSTNLGVSGPPLYPDLRNRDVYRRDLTAARTIVVSRHLDRSHAYGPVISADGRFVAFFREGIGSRQVFERDLATGKATLVSRAGGPEGEAADRFGSRSFLAISSDGSLIAFSSAATNHGAPSSPDGAAGNSALYLRDFRTAQTSFVGWEAWAKPRLVAGGRYLFFGTFDTGQPAPYGASAVGDIYRYDRGPRP
jgi:TolB protein